MADFDSGHHQDLTSYLIANPASNMAGALQINIKRLFLNSGERGFSREDVFRWMDMN